VTSSPFARRQLLRPSILQRLLGRQPPRNALVELANVLADDPLLETTTRETVKEIETRHEVDLETRFAQELEEIYRDYLLHCLRDRQLSALEIEAARRLADALDLARERRKVIQSQVARRIYLEMVEQVLEDGIVDSQEQEFLDELQEHLELPDDLAENMLELRRKQFRQRWGPTE